MSILQDGPKMLSGHGTKRQRDILQKTQGHCTYCGLALRVSLAVSRDQLCIDHLIPRARGGSNRLCNLVPTCRRCNCQKRSRLLEEFREDLFRKRHAVFTERHLAHLAALGVVLPEGFPGYPPVVFWFEQQGITL